MRETWWKEAVVYQIYPRSFMDSNGDGVGDLPGITSKLDYLKELGVNVIWLSPVYQSPNDDNGYDISNYRDIMAEFGTMADFDIMLNEMHKRGLRLMMDLVVNHTSDEHPWFKAACEDKSSPYRNYYFFKDGRDGREPNNWRSYFSGPAWEKEPHGDQYYLHLFSKKQPDLNWDNPAVRDDVFDMMNFWVGKGVDGFRMDVINHISKVPGLPDMPGEGLQMPAPLVANGPHVHEYLQEMNRRVLAGHDLITVGEMGSTTAEEARLYTAEDRNELQMIFQFEHMDVDGQGDKYRLRPWKLTDFKKVITKWQTALYGSCWNSNYLSNHDQARQVSRFGNDKEYWCKSAKLLGTFLHTLSGTPYIYQGEELGMTNAPFEKLEDFRDLEVYNYYKEMVTEGDRDSEEVMEAFRKKSRDNARTPMQWDSAPNAGFTKGKPWIMVNPNYDRINAAEQLRNPYSIFHHYQQLIGLRRDYKALVYGDFNLLLADNEHVFAYLRSYKGQVLLVLLNFFGETECFELPEIAVAPNAKLLITDYNRPAGGLAKQMTLRPYEGQVWLLQD